MLVRVVEEIVDAVGFPPTETENCRGWDPGTPSVLPAPKKATVRDETRRLTEKKKKTKTKKKMKMKMTVAKKAECMVCRNSFRSLLLTGVCRVDEKECIEEQLVDECVQHIGKRCRSSYSVGRVRG